MCTAWDYTEICRALWDLQAKLGSGDVQIWLEDLPHLPAHLWAWKVRSHCSCKLAKMNQDEPRWTKHCRIHSLALHWLTENQCLTPVSITVASWHALKVKIATYWQLLTLKPGANWDLQFRVHVSLEDPNLRLLHLQYVLPEAAQLPQVPPALPRACELHCPLLVA